LCGLFYSLPWNIQIFLWKDPSLHGKMWQGFKDFRCILVFLFIFYYFNGTIFRCWNSHVEENDGCCLDEYVDGRFPYLLPSLCNTVLAIALLFIVFQLPVCGTLNFLGFLLTLCYN
jgi:hypothetical protein